MLRVFLVAAVLVLLCVFGLCVGIIFRKDGRFPQFDVGSNEEMRKRGILCMSEEQKLMDASRAGGKVCPGNFSEACEGCSLNPNKK